jgi:putative heme iron utilization protein
MVFNPEFFTYGTEAHEVNQLLKYLQHQSPEVLARIAKSVSPEIKDIISRNVQGLVGVLPADGFDVQISTDRENMAGMLASAMMTGYFLRQMEQRMELDKGFSSAIFNNLSRSEESGF